MKLMIELNAVEIRKTIESGTLIRLVADCQEDVVPTVVEAIAPVPTPEPQAPQHYMENAQQMPPVQMQQAPQQPIYEQHQYPPMQVAPQQYPPQNAVQPGTPQQMQAPPMPQAPQQIQQAPQQYQPQQAPAPSNGPGISDIQAVLATAMKNGANLQIEQLWASFGVNKLSDLQPHQYSGAYVQAQQIAASVAPR